MVFDEEEDVDDYFVPRKLFLFSFAHFKVSRVFKLLFMIVGNVIVAGFFFGLCVCSFFISWHTFLGGGGGVGKTKLFLFFSKFDFFNVGLIEKTCNKK